MAWIRELSPAPHSGQAPLTSRFLVLLIRDDDPLLFERAAVRWLSRYPANDRDLRLAETRELVDMVAGVGRHDQVATMRLYRFLRARGYEVEADRLSA